MRTETKLIIAAGLTVLLGITLMIWLGGPRLPRSLSAIQETGRLVVLTLEGPTIYEETTDGVEGYEVDLVNAFADSLGVDVEFRIAEDLDSLLSQLNAGRAHFAAGSLAATETRQAQLTLGPAYKNVTEQLVCHRERRLPKDVEALAGEPLILVAGSSYEETLTALQDEHFSISWDAKPAATAMPLLTQIADTGTGCTVADSHLVAYARRRHPELSVAFDLTEDRPLSWAVNARTEGLSAALDAWFAEAHESGLLRQFDEHWFGHLDDFDYVDVASFRRRVKSRLADYRPLFETAAERHGFDWRLLAAQSYQESHWDPEARSVTGVRGLMMLTLPTAREVGIEDRLDPAQSIDGGAIYLRRIYDRLPDSIVGPDRLWFALAAYNVGFGHLEDARVLADRDGLDPNIWADVSDMLPRLTRSQYYRTVRFGYARGYEPVHYVRKIREYEAILDGALAEQAVLIEAEASEPLLLDPLDGPDVPG
ncbi:MAG: membrane-bound lytic murein transglycosylase MltF [Pseudomonadota bacterium]